MPLPELPEGRLTHEALLEADQLQPEVATTLTVPVPPEELKTLLVGLIEYVHA